MSYIDSILRIASAHNGFVTSAEATEKGIPRRCLTQAVEDGLLLKTECGLYMLPDAWEDEFLTLQHRFKKGVFSHETSHFLHGLTDRPPAEFTMAFPHSYNAKSAQEKGIIVKKSIERRHSLGLRAVGTPYGNEVFAHELRVRLQLSDTYLPAVLEAPA